MSKELKERLDQAQQKFLELRGIFDLYTKQKRVEEIDELSSAQDFWNDSKRAGGLTKERDGLVAMIDRASELEKSLADAQAVLELAGEEDAADLVKEAQADLAKVEKALDELEFERMLSGENDRNSAILTINAGAGGTEACDWAGMLLRMYERWADSKGFSHEIVDFTPGEGAGYKSVTITIDGEYAYGYLKAENGVHRLVRISPFDANKRRHTSFTSVFVIPEISDDIEIDIKEDDLRVDTFRAGGAGGQHVNKTDSAVRMTHLPTGIVAVCRSDRSQHKNRAGAMKLLRAKLYEAEMEKRRAEQDAMEAGKKRIEWGSQIRSYVLQPYRMVKDHRTNVEMGNVDAVLDGDIDEFIRKFLLQEASTSTN
ncbi:MAG: peptide chain release factor 2 [Pseudomonadota bacterium]